MKKKNYHTVGTVLKPRKTKTTTLSEQFQNPIKNVERSKHDSK